MRRPVPLVSVVVATRDRRERLEALLGALERQTTPPERFEVIVVDDGSRDSTPELLRTAREAGRLSLRSQRSGESRGPAAARNGGWRAARSPLIAFTDDDCEPVPGWLAALVAAAGRTPGAIVQGHTSPNPAERVANTPFTRSLHVPALSPHYQTANILYPRAVLEQLDGFDESYGAPAGEDTDLGWRAMAAGVPTVFAPDAAVHHAVHHRSLRDTLRDAQRATDCVKSYRDHPGLRRHLDAGVFFHRSHPYLALAALGAAAAAARPAALLLTLPYGAHVWRRARWEGVPMRVAPALALRDGVELLATVRGALRHRVLVL